MNLRQLAEADLASTLEDSTFGFGVSISVTDPDGTSATIGGQSGDIHFMIDPNTGVAVSGRVAHVALRLATLVSAGLNGVPTAITNSSGKPWVITFSGLTCIIKEARPDRTLGVVTLLLEHYDN